MARSHAPTPFPRRFAVRDRGGRPGLASNQSSDCLPDDCLLVSQLRDSAGLRVRRTRHRLPPLRPRASGQRGTTVTSIGFEQQYNIRGMDCQTFTQAAAAGRGEHVRPEQDGVRLACLATSNEGGVRRAKNVRLAVASDRPYSRTALPQGRSRPVPGAGAGSPALGPRPRR